MTRGLGFALGAELTWIGIYLDRNLLGRSGSTAARTGFAMTRAPTPRSAEVPIGVQVYLPIRFTWPIRSTLADLAKFGRSSPLWLIRSTMADQFHVGRSSQGLSIRSTLADQIYSG